MASKPKGFDDETPHAEQRRRTWPSSRIAPALSATKPVDITQAGFSPRQGDDRLRRHRHVDEQGHWATTRCWPIRWRFQPRRCCLANQTYSYTFTKSGSFGYRDALKHGSARDGHRPPRRFADSRAGDPPSSTGGSATLSGVVSSRASGETVTIDAMECGTTTFTRVATVTSTANGAWTSPAKPAKNAVYEAHWKNTEERSADREGRAGPLAEARTRRPLLGHRDRSAVLRREVRRAPALHPQPAAPGRPSSASRCARQSPARRRP